MKKKQTQAERENITLSVRSVRAERRRDQKTLKRYQNKLRAELNAAPVAKRADVFVRLTTKGLTTAVVKSPYEAARMVEDVRLEFKISEKDLDEAFERAGIPVEPFDRVVDEKIKTGEFVIVS